jgi:hypothetical protein
MGPIATTTDGRFIEAFVSAHVLNHEISFGKQDDWLGPGLGGGMAYWWVGTGLAVEAACACPPSQNPPSGFPATGSTGCTHGVQSLPSP